MCRGRPGPPLPHPPRPPGLAASPVGASRPDHPGRQRRRVTSSQASNRRSHALTARTGGERSSPRAVPLATAVVVTQRQTGLRASSSSPRPARAADGAVRPALRSDQSPPPPCARVPRDHGRECQRDAPRASRAARRRVPLPPPSPGARPTLGQASRSDGPRRGAPRRAVEPRRRGILALVGGVLLPLAPSPASGGARVGCQHPRGPPPRCPSEGHRRASMSG